VADIEGNSIGSGIRVDRGIRTAAPTDGPWFAVPAVDIVTSIERLPCWIENGSLAMRRRSRSTRHADIRVHLGGHIVDDKKARG
jgi:hypothetical protein